MCIHRFNSITVTVRSLPAPNVHVVSIDALHICIVMHLHNSCNTSGKTQRAYTSCTSILILVWSTTYKFTTCTFPQRRYTRKVTPNKKIKKETLWCNIQMYLRVMLTYVHSKEETYTAVQCIPLTRVVYRWRNIRNAILILRLTQITFYVPFLSVYHLTGNATFTYGEGILLALTENSWKF